MPAARTIAPRRRSTSRTTAGTPGGGGKSDVRGRRWGGAKDDSIFLGAVVFPGVTDHVSLWGLLIPIRRGFQQYVNLRPVRLMPGVPSPLANRKPGDIDFWVVRENNEGEYSSVGGRMHAGTELEFATQLSIFTPIGVDRILKFSF